MPLKNTLRYWLSLAALWLGSASLPAADQPNILWLVSEDNTTLLGCYGDPLARTPTIDRLAREGVLYERCFTQPVCAPSRFGLITGVFAASCGPAEHMRASGNIPAWLKGFPTFLREAGYYTTNNAKTDYNSPIKPDLTWHDSGKTAHYKNRPDPKQPFFAVFNHEVTHESCLFPERDVKLPFEPTDPARVRIPPYQPDTPEMRSDWARYYDHIALMDAQLAAKLKALEEEKLAEDTIIFYYADNGGVLPRGKRYLQRSGSNVPLIVYFPPKWKHLAPAAAGTRVKDPVCFIDFAPTMLSLIGAKIPAYMQGQPFAGTAKAKPNEYVFCTRDRMDERYDMMRSVIDSRYLYIRNFRPDIPYIQPINYMFRARGYQSWARMAKEGKLTTATTQFWGPKPTEELYDLEQDPDNVHNLAYKAEHRATVERMRQALKQHTLAIVDNGFMPEGSATEGYEAARVAGAYPLEAAFEMAMLASERNPEHLPKLIEGLKANSEPVRWWAAQGCVMHLEGRKAEPELIACLSDASPAVQVAAAEALVRHGKADIGLAALSNVLLKTTNKGAAMQAANACNRLGELARPALPALKELLARANNQGGDAVAKDRYVHDMTEYVVKVLEGQTERLVYPAP
jgi:arylsulfatase A-like enzyme